MSPPRSNNVTEGVSEYGPVRLGQEGWGQSWPCCCPHYPRIITHSHARTHGTNTHECTHMGTHTPGHSHTWVLTHGAYTQVHTHGCAHRYTHGCTNTHGYTHTHMRAHVHTRTHTYMRSVAGLPHVAFTYNRVNAIKSPGTEGMGCLLSESTKRYGFPSENPHPAPLMSHTSPT